jgi:hypothetical protein
MPNDLAALEQQFNQLVLNDQPKEAIQRFYAEDASLQENTEPAIVGKPAILAREAGFLSSVAESKPPVLHSVAIGKDVTFSEWTFDMTLKDGKRVVLHEVARRQWKDGHVIHERFYHPPF